MKYASDDLKRNCEFGLEAVKEGGGFVYEELHGDCLINKSIIYTTIEKDPRQIENVPDRIKNSAFLLELTSWNPKLYPLVVKYIGELREERLKKYEINYDTHVAELGRIKDAALKKGAWSAAVNAETNRGKAAGLYIDRKIIKTGKLEDLSELELENKMKQILDDYSQIIDVTPDKKITE